MLNIKNIDVLYGDVQVIWDVSFEVGKGEIVALIGANGAGKINHSENHFRYLETQTRERSSLRPIPSQN